MAGYSLSLALLAASTLASALPQAVAMAPRAGNGFLSYPVSRRMVPQKLARRDDSTTLYNYSNIAYLIHLDVGTPPQPVEVQLDTGSNELWLNPECDTVSSDDNKAFCKTLDVYDGNKSSTYYRGKVYSKVNYGIGSAHFEYVLDDISLPGTNNSALKLVQFGVVTKSQDVALPIMGVGFGKGYNTNYHNIIDELKLQGGMALRAFSMALGTTSSSSDDTVGQDIGDGGIIFGGVDTKKFTGPLYQFTNLPPQENDGGLWRYWVQLDSVGYTAPGDSTSVTYSNSSLPVLLDSGSTWSYLPSHLLDDLASSLDIKSHDIASDGTMTIDCDKGRNGGSVDFQFGDLTISVPLSDIIWESDGDCSVGIMPSGDDTPLLGDTFLRSAYVVFDQDHKHIYLAEAANCGTNEQALDAGGHFNLTGECTVSKKTSAAAAAAYPGLLSVLLASAGVAAMLL